MAKIKNIENGKIAYFLKNKAYYFYIEIKTKKKEGPFLGSNFPYSEIDLETHSIEKENRQNGDHHPNGEMLIKANGSVRVG